MARDWLGRERQEDLASQVTRGALKWGAPVHPPIPNDLIVQPGNPPHSAPTLEKATVRPSMAVWKGLNEPYTGQSFSVGGHGASDVRVGGNKPIWVSPTYGGAHIYADIDRALDSDNLLGFKPRPGTLLQGNIPEKEFRAGLHYNPKSEAHQLLMGARQADLAFGAGSQRTTTLGLNAGTGPNIAPSRATTMHVPRVNRFALPFNPELAKYPWFTKIAGRAARLAPGANIALGGIDMARRARERDYVGAGLSAVSMVPGPVGWLGLGGQVLYDVGRGLIGRQGDSPVQHTPRGLLGQKG